MTSSGGRTELDVLQGETVCGLTADDWNLVATSVEFYERDRRRVANRRGAAIDSALSGFYALCQRVRLTARENQRQALDTSRSPTGRSEHQGSSPDVPPAVS